MSLDAMKSNTLNDNGCASGIDLVSLEPSCVQIFRNFETPDFLRMYPSIDEKKVRLDICFYPKRNKEIDMKESQSMATSAKNNPAENEE
jgi:hypothetical protein